MGSLCIQRDLTSPQWNPEHLGAVADALQSFPNGTEGANNAQQTAAQYLYIIHAKEQRLLFSIVAHAQFCPWNRAREVSGGSAFRRFEALETKTQKSLPNHLEVSLLRGNKNGQEWKLGGRREPSGSSVKPS